MSKTPPASLGAQLIRKGEPVLEPRTEPRPEPAKPPPKLGTIAVTLRLDPERYERLKTEAANSRRTNQDILRDALDLYLTRDR